MLLFKSIHILNDAQWKSAQAEMSSHLYDATAPIIQIHLTCPTALGARRLSRTDGTDK